MIKAKSARKREGVEKAFDVYKNMLNADKMTGQ